jgi:hypothetical protein
MAAIPGCRHPAEWSVLLTVSEHVATTHHRPWSSRSPNGYRCSREHRRLITHAGRTPIRYGRPKVSPYVI